MEEPVRPAPEWLTDQSIRWISLGAGVILAAVALGLTLALGNFLFDLLHGAGPGILVLIVLLVLTGGAGWILKRRRRRANSPLPTPSAVALAWVLFALAALAAHAILIVSWLVTSAVLGRVQNGALHALLFAIAGYVLFVSVPLRLVENCVQLFRLWPVRNAASSNDEKL